MNLHNLVGHAQVTIFVFTNNTEFGGDETFFEEHIESRPDALHNLE